MLGLEFSSDSRILSISKIESGKHKQPAKKTGEICRFLIALGYYFCLMLSQLLIIGSTIALTNLETCAILSPPQVTGVAVIGGEEVT
jgi:hypothetical protein